MERITLYLRTTNTSGKIKLRFRLTEGREVQLFHKSQIDTDLADLKKFEMDGSLKPRVSIYNKKLRIAITREIEAMREANLLKDENSVFQTQRPSSSNKSLILHLPVEPAVINFLTEYSVGIL